MKGMKCFLHTAKVVNTNRKKVEISQSDLAHSLGYKSGQYISNLERGICGIPPEKIPALAIVLDIEESEIIEANMMDYGDYLVGVVSKITNEKSFN